MNRKWKKITFVLLDVIVLGFFGFYLALNLKYKDSDELNSDFAMKVLDNETSNDTVTCGANAYASGGKCVCNSGYSPNSDGKSCYCPTPSKPGVGKSCGTISANGTTDTCTFETQPSYTVTVTSGSSAISVSGGTITAKSISSKTCKVSFSVSVVDTNSCGNQSEAAIVSGEVMVPWSGTQPSKCYKYISQETAEANNYSLYTPNCIDETNKCGTGGKWCEIKTRGCGSAPPVPLPHCYDTGYGLLEWALKETVVNNKIQSNMPSGWKIAKDANGNELTKDQCYTQFKCSTKYPGADTKESACKHRHITTSCVKLDSS